MTDSPVQAFEQALSIERFGRYVAWAGGDRERAIALYTLNTQLSECLYTPLQMLEVALRNRIHAVLTAAANEQWLDLPEYQKGSRQTEQLAKAKEDLAGDGKVTSPSQIVAALTFGYWTSFLGHEYEDTWQQTLRHIARRVDCKGLRR